MNNYCKDCKYFGSESDRKYGSEPQYVCECEKSNFKSCAKLAVGCDRFKRKENKRI